MVMTAQISLLRHSTHYSCISRNQPGTFHPSPPSLDRVPGRYNSPRVLYHRKPVISLSFASYVTADSHLSKHLSIVFLPVCPILSSPNVLLHSSRRKVQLIRVEVECECFVELRTVCALLESCFLPFSRSNSEPV